MWTSLWLGLAAWAQEPDPTGGPEVGAPAPLVSEKPRRPYEIAALPIGNYSSNTGIGYGAFGAVVRTADPDSDDPFRWRVSLQIYFTTGQYMDHNVNVDVPGLFGPGTRWDLLVGYEAWAEAPWFGVGNLAPRQPAVGDPDDPDYAFHLYDVRWLRTLTNVRAPIGGSWDAFGQYFVRYAGVDVYEGSLLELQQPVGLEGGFYARLGGGIMLDTRDAEPSPTEGVFSEASLRVSHLVVGSQYPVVGFNLTDRRWYPIDKAHRLVLANRAILDLRRGEEPFFASPLLGGSQFVELGGSANLRGLPTGRYRGDIVALWTTELRWLAVSPGPLDIILAPFFDVGRVALWPDDPAFDEGEAVKDDLLHLHYAGGVGARFQLGQSMLVRLDTAFAKEEILRGDEIVKEPSFGFYLVFDHPF